MTAVFAWALRGFRKQVLWYGIGLGAYAAATVFLYPPLKDTLAQLEASVPREILAAFGGDEALSMTTGRGFITLRYFAIAPLVFAAFAAAAATGMLAGDESAGTLEPVVTLPISRRRLFLERLAALAVACVGIAAFTAAGFAIAMIAVDMGDFSLGDALRGTFGQLPFVAFVVSVGLFLGAVAPSRGTAAGVAGALVASSYVLITLGNAVPGASWMRYFSPHYYADLTSMLTSGVDPLHWGVLIGISMLLLVAALRAFEGRELGSDHWQWRAFLLGGPRAR